MRDWDAEQLAALAGGSVVRAQPGAGATGATVDSRSVSAGELFVGLRGEREDGGAHAPDALARGAWGVLVTPQHATAAARSGTGNVISHPDPLAGLQALARAWREQLGKQGAQVVAITGSTGKTSTKDILAALLATIVPSARTPANLNTEIGLPLAILAAPPGTRALVLEMAMRAPGQIAELAAIAEPDVGVIVNVGPAHLEMLGSLEAIAAAKAELIAGLAPGACAVVPAGEPLLAPHLRPELRTISFGDGGDVVLRERLADGEVLIEHDGEPIRLRPSFSQAHNLRNLLAAVAAARALGLTPAGPLQVEFSAMRGQRERLQGDVTLIDDCYNANPISMRAAIDDLIDSGAPVSEASRAGRAARRVAVLGDMLELGPQAPQMHREIGAHARARGVELLVAVGALATSLADGYGAGAVVLADAAAAAEHVAELVRDGDTVLLKASRGLGLERAAQALRAARGHPLAPSAAVLSGPPERR